LSGVSWQKDQLYRTWFAETRQENTIDIRNPAYPPLVGGHGEVLGPGEKEWGEKRREYEILQTGKGPCRGKQGSETGKRGEISRICWVSEVSREKGQYW